jgi:lipopolysaccharide export system permease protein
MQFLWQYLNDMVGKGVSTSILIELFFNAALLLTSMALPLSVLIASLITFGNFGERSELLAMKSSGISLFQIMKPLIFFSSIISITSFIFQNSIVPKSQSKMVTIILSLREKSPELDIPEKVFYKEIPKFNIYIGHKNKKNGHLYDVKIYDYSKGSENVTIITADSGKIDIATEKQHLFITLYNGKLFQNFGINVNKKFYLRETFGLRKILINFDMNFKMKNESVILKHDLSKNIYELINYINSDRKLQDSINLLRIKYLKQNIYSCYKPKKVKNEYKDTNINILESYYKNFSNKEKIECLRQAQYESEKIQYYYYMSMIRQNDLKAKLRSHYVYLYKKFSLSISCLFFFFIGAPLGAIIKKGGIGLPIVISISIFLLYYITDTFGSKLAKEGIIPIEYGMFLSTFIIIVAAILFVNKAANDSMKINYKTCANLFFKKLRLL